MTDHIAVRLGMCRIDFFISLRFLKTRLIWFGMSLVRFGSKNEVLFRYYRYVLLM